jgi:hypothetical protein
MLKEEDMKWSKKCKDKEILEGDLNTLPCEGAKYLLHMFCVFVFVLNV